MEAEVCNLSVNREGCYTHLHAEHFKTWLREKYPEKEATDPTQTRKIDETCGAGPVHVGARDYPCRAGMDNLDPNPQGQHRYLMDMDLGGPMGGDRYHSLYTYQEVRDVP